MVPGGFLLFFMVPGQSLWVFKVLSLVFLGSRWLFMVFHGSGFVFHGSMWFSMVYSNKHKICYKCRVIFVTGTFLISKGV